MNNLFKTIEDLRKAGKSFVLCIVTKTEGSTPRKAGSKMLVLPGRKIVGTIGGGSVENKIIDRDWFAWPSMFTGGVYNTSVYESIKQTIDNSLVNPKERNSGIIHTIFLKTTYYN